MSDPPSTSPTLLERVRRHDQEAWARLVYLYAPLIIHWCHTGGVRGADADDLRQEVFQAVAARIADFRRDRPGDTFRGWLRGITRHKLLDHYRKRQGQPAAAGGTDAQQRLLEVADPVEPTETPEQVTGLYHRALELVRAEFEVQTWQMFWRVAVEDQAPADVAAELNVTPAAVRKAKSRVLRRLREEVGDLLE